MGSDVVGSYYMQLKEKQSQRLLELATEIDGISNQLSSQPNYDEEVYAFFRATAGQARLLASQKLKQFEDLCLRNMEVKLDGPPVLDKDLEAYWEIVLMQIEEVDMKAAEINDIKNNNFVMPQRKQQQTRPRSLAGAHATACVSQPVLPGTPDSRAPDDRRPMRRSAPLPPKKGGPRNN